MNTTHQENTKPTKLESILGSGVFVDNFTRAMATLYATQNMLGHVIPTKIAERLVGNRSDRETLLAAAAVSGISSVLPQLQLPDCRRCTGHSPITSALCSITCDSSCDRDAQAFCAATSANMREHIDYLDPAIVDGCSCLQSPYTAWVASLQIGDSTRRILNNPPCLDGGRCRQYGYKLRENIAQAQQCPMICSNVYQIMTGTGHVNSSGNVQQCMISADTNYPVVMINRQRINATDSDNISVFDPSLNSIIALVGMPPLQS